MIELLPILLGVILAQISPGPNMLAVSSVALGSGRAAGVYTAAGVATGVLGWAILFAFGIGAFLTAFPSSIIAMKFIGGGYLLYMGLKAIIGVFRKTNDEGKNRASKSTKANAFIKGLLVVITNPKAAMMWVAIALYLATSNPSDSLYLIVGACASLSALIIYGIYAVLFSTGFAVKVYGRFFKFIETSFGLLFCAIAMMLITDGIEDMRR